MVAQFKAATIAETTYQKNPGPTPSYGLVDNTGNDILIQTINQVNYEFKVTVWDGSIPSLGWDFVDNTGSYYGIEDLPTEVMDPDVCIMQRNSEWLALIAYRDANNNQPKLLVEKFNTSSKTWSIQSNTTLGNGNSIHTAINIDSDQDEHFFVVWDQFDANNKVKVFGAAGAHNGTNLQICMTNYEFPTFRDKSGTNQIDFPYHYPDVAVMDLPNNNNNPGQVKVTFIGGTCATFPSAINMLCVTDELVFSKFGLCQYTAPSQNLDYEAVAKSGEQIAWPRIARHRRNGSVGYVQEGFTVVYEFHRPSAGLYDIKGKTVFYDYVTNAPNLIIHEHDRIYTDGGIGAQFVGSQNILPPINNILNRRPVVTYERKSGHVDPSSKQIMCIAFEHAININQAQGFVASFYAHNSNGAPFTDPPFPQPSNYLYYQIPTNVSDRTYGISVSGELSENFMYSFSNFYQQTMHHKEVSSFAHLRQGIFANADAPSIKCITLHNNFMPVFFNEVSEDMQWTDTQGKLLSTNIGEAESIIVNLNPGISYMSYRNADGYFQKVKLIKL
ncbi:MAG: hypothetical protein WAS72_04630 [Saprospiraceae bacterium]